MTGARAGELCGLRWSDVDLGAGTVHIARSVHTADGGGAKVPKSGHGRTLNLDPVAVEVFRSRFAFQRDRWDRVVGRSDYQGRGFSEDPWVLSFWSDGSDMPRPDSYGSAFRRLADGLDLGHLHLHSMRHFMVTHLLDQGMPLAVASERAGHSSPAVTARI